MGSRGMSESAGSGGTSFTTPADYSSYVRKGLPTENTSLHDLFWEAANFAEDATEVRMLETLGEVLPGTKFDLEVKRWGVKISESYSFTKQSDGKWNMTGINSVGSEWINENYSTGHTATEIMKIFLNGTVKVSNFKLGSGK